MEGLVPGDLTGLEITVMSLVFVRPFWSSFKRLRRACLRNQCGTRVIVGIIRLHFESSNSKSILRKTAQLSMCISSKDHRKQNTIIWLADTMSRFSHVHWLSVDFLRCLYGVSPYYKIAFRLLLFYSQMCKDWVDVLTRSQSLALFQNKRNSK